MKRIEFIAPVEALRGNMSGSQKLVYAENDNPAYDAPDGRQYARNYKPRYIGFRRAKDGAVYFGVKKKSATKINKVSKVTMAALGSIQDLKNTFKNEQITTTVGPVTGTYWSFILLAYQTAVYVGEVEPGVGVDKWIDGLLVDMMRYRQSELQLRFKLNPNQPTYYTLTIASPYASYDEAALPITQRNFVKFNPVLSCINDSDIIYINGMPIVYEPADSLTWAVMHRAISADSVNLTTQLTPLVATGTEALTWQGNQVYSSTGVAQTGDTPILTGEKYTTFYVSE